MFVATGAVEILRQQRKEQFYDKFIANLIAEAKRLHLSEADIKSMIERGFKQ